MKTLDPRTRRWTVIASGLLCGAMAMVVLFTNRGAFYSPLAVVVMGAVGLAAVLLQLRLQDRDKAQSASSPAWLNILGILFALAAFFGDLSAHRTATHGVAGFGSGRKLWHQRRNHSPKLSQAARSQIDGKRSSCPKTDRSRQHPCRLYNCNLHYGMRSMATRQVEPSIDEYLRKRLMPVEGAIPQLAGIDMYGNSIPAEYGGRRSF